MLAAAVAPLPARRVTVRAASDDVNAKLQETLSQTTDKLAAAWDKTEDKPAAVAVTFGALLVLITASSVVDTIVSISTATLMPRSPLLSCLGLLAPTVWQQLPSPGLTKLLFAPCRTRSPSSAT